MRAMGKSDDRNIAIRTKSVILLDEIIVIAADTQTPAYQLTGAGVEAGQFAVSYAHDLLLGERLYSRTIPSTIKVIARRSAGFQPKKFSWAF